MASTATSRVLAAVQDERWRQEAKWGEQHHSDLHLTALADSFVSMATAYKTMNEGTTSMGGDPDWTGILLEEVYEALAETNSGNVRALQKELIQVAAVCVAWCEDIRSRRATTD